MMQADAPGIEQIPELDAATMESPQRVQVRFDVQMAGGKLDFIFVDTTPWPPGSHEHAVGLDADGNTCLLIERGQDRIFEVSLGENVDWAFDPDNSPGRKGMTIKKGNAALYDAEVVAPGLLLISAKSRPNPPAGGAKDFFNFFVKMGQSSGQPIPLRIDPISRNPP